MTKSFRDMYTDDGFQKMMESAGTEGSLAERYPFYPLLSPGMPGIGPNFKREAEALIGSAADAMLPDNFEVLKVREQKQLLKSAEGICRNHYASYLYYRALYDDDFCISVMFNGRPKPVTYIPGHLWGYEADGPRRAPVMIVGKNPGRDEAEEKRNFVGPTSEYFRGILERLGLHGHTEWYVTNVVRFPNFNPTSDSVPASWISDCMPLLHQEIRLVRPTYMLLLGSEAISAVLGRGQTFKATNGRVHQLDFPINGPGEDPVFHTVSVITCVHPAAVAHDPKHEDDLVKTIRYFRNVITGGATAADPEAACEHIICHSAEHLNEIANRMEQEKRTEFAIDTEFDGDTPKDGMTVMVQFSWQEKKAVVVELRDEKLNETFQGGTRSAVKLMDRIFRGRNKRIIGHYFSADLWWLKALGLDFMEEQFATSGDDEDPDGVNRFFGWQKTAWEGGFDTILAAHAHEETADLGLKELTLRHTSMPNYEVELDKWKKSEALRLKCGVQELPGFGACPREILRPYAAYDADGTFRLYRLYNNPAGLLDKDRFGNCCRIPFWISMRACLAFYEMHEQGMPVDVSRVESQTALYRQARDDLKTMLRQELRWGSFNPDSPIQCKEFMFGTKYNGKVDKKTGENISVRPEGARTLDLIPYKTTGKRPKLWDRIRQSGKEKEFTPSVDKETLTAYADLDPAVEHLRDLRYLGQVMKTILKPPKEEDGVPVLDEDGRKVYIRGLMSFLQPGDTVHTNFSQNKETGRASSWRPPLQNISKKREPDYKRILRNRYQHSLRSIFVAPPGYAMVSADYTGAELLGMAIQAGDANMISHCNRSNLPESGYSLDGVACSHGSGCKQCVFPHPDYYDIHANVAVKAFQPKDPKTGEFLQAGRLARYELGRAKLKHYRDGAKPVDFGYAYGMTGEAAYRKAREGGANITRDDAEMLIKGLEAQYPELPVYYAEAAGRSHEPMWMANCFGRYRRTYSITDRKSQGDVERQFKNFPIQSLVADAVSLALANFLDYRAKHNLHFRLALQLHDDIISMVPIQELERYHDEAVPECMEHNVDIWPCDFDGRLKPDPNAPYHLKPGRSVYLRWGEPITAAQAEQHGIPARFVGAGD